MNACRVKNYTYLFSYDDRSIYEKWLQNFAYRIDISWWLFMVAGVILVLIALFTISFQSIKAALANPVKNLRAE